MTMIKDELKKTMEHHRKYKLMWEKIKIDEYRGSLMIEWKNMQPVVAFPYLPTWFFRYRRKIYGSFGLTIKVDRITDELDEISRLREVDNTITDKMYDMWNIQVESPEDDKIESIAKEIQNIIDSNLEAMAKLIYKRETKAIESLVTQGRLLLASMREIQKQSQSLTKIDDLFDGSEFDDKIKSLELAFDRVHNLRDEAEGVIKDAIMPALIKYIVAVASLIAATGYLFFGLN